MKKNNISVVTLNKKKAICKQYITQKRCINEYTILSIINNKVKINCPHILKHDYKNRLNYFEFIDNSSKIICDPTIQLSKALSQLKKIHSIKLDRAHIKQFCLLHKTTSNKDLFVIDFKQKLDYINSHIQIIDKLEFDIKNFTRNVNEFIDNNTIKFEKCIIHGDFSFRNILTNTEGRVYLIDFEHASIVTKEFDFSKLYDNDFSHLSFNDFHRLIDKQYRLNKTHLKSAISWGRIGLIYYLIKQEEYTELTKYVQIFKQNKL